MDYGIYNSFHLQKLMEFIILNRIFILLNRELIFPKNAETLVKNLSYVIDSKNCYNLSLRKTEYIRYCIHSSSQDEAVKKLI